MTVLQTRNCDANRVDRTSCSSPNGQRWVMGASQAWIRSGLDCAFVHDPQFRLPGSTGLARNRFCGAVQHEAACGAVPPAVLHTPDESALHDHCNTNTTPSKHASMPGKHMDGAPDEPCRRCKGVSVLVVRSEPLCQSVLRHLGRRKRRIR